MSKDNLLRCDTCGMDTHQIDTPIFEKPLRFAFRSDIKTLQQNNSSKRTQENICLDCFSKELKELSKNCKTRCTVTFI
ncbi:hypothetical protein FNE59_19975 [Bacillus thuringiensis]|uniref:hypothetical protein n=1 Tax=Bacillus thuringiensis TaxID=1428 RepID=UPI0024BCF91E|nr:hypothetical protein [Bacillus thuringiensis]MDR5047791.1 hypothetical protein [Bacillus thuringiensis]